MGTKIVAEKYQRLVGKRLNKDVYYRAGALCLPVDAILTERHLSALQDLGVHIDESDVEKEPTDISLKINMAVDEIKDIFRDAKNSKPIFMKRIEKRIIPLFHKLVSTYDLKELLAELLQKDDYTFRHSIAVGALSTLIGTWLKLPKDDLETLAAAAVLHDIGKVRIDSSILLKNDRLTPEEFDEMKTHTLLGYDMVNHIHGASEKHALVALQHHERSDGSGYPYGLQAKDIDLLSRIVTVADVFHAMSSKRPYKDALPFYKVVKKMVDGSFGKFDPVVMTTFMHKIMESLIGNEVVLSNGHKGKIITIKPNDLWNPLVQVGGSFVDLSQYPPLNIERI